MSGGSGGRKTRRETRLKARLSIINHNSKVCTKFLSICAAQLDRCSSAASRPAEPLLWPASRPSASTRPEVGASECALSIGARRSSARARSSAARRVLDSPRSVGRRAALALDRLWAVVAAAAAAKVADAAAAAAERPKSSPAAPFHQPKELINCAQVALRALAQKPSAERSCLCATCPSARVCASVRLCVRLRVCSFARPSDRWRLRRRRRRRRHSGLKKAMSARKRASAQFTQYTLALVRHDDERPANKVRAAN